uniref:Uncharacterized protein n=1 Tax=Peronospora matthiolae TaxID=2874970 RepID=A0AAV1UH72_9STRA
MEFIRKEQVSKDQKGSRSQSSGSALVVGAGMSLRALKRTHSPKKTSNVSPATYFGARRLNQANVGGKPAGHVEANFNMGPISELVDHRQEVQSGFIPGGGMPNKMYIYPGPQVANMPDAQHRKLAL